MPEEKLEELYGEFLESEATASNKVTNTYSKMNKAFTEYLDAFQDDLFRSVFTFAYAKGFEAAQKGGGIA